MLAGCRRQQDIAFPPAGRDVAPVVSDQFSTEDARDRLGEAEEVMRLARVAPGMMVADIGAGEGYYTVRLAPAVGKTGRILAEDIDAGIIDRLAQRVQHEGLDNVAVRLGTPDDPKLPAGTFDRIFLVHMYHEVTSPYAFLWHLRDGLKPGGEIVVVDADRPTNRHGIPPARLACEMAALNLHASGYNVLNGGDSFVTRFTIAGPKPAPGAIKPCERPDS
ncbi:class I SAM-dependent methyltransferase [Sphingomonas sp. ASV193]|uniref:class I SAM-dependent methyltransferase n=1 Tax=Sphingomonas sp. ASV193 TaxID=3144405 RepID=UPI0032E886A9